MNIEKIRNEANNLFNQCCKLGLNSSYITVFKSMQETASERKNYLKFSLIQDLIIEEINS